MKEENEFFRKLKNAFLPPLFFLSSAGLFPPFPKFFSYFRLAFSVAGAVLCAVFFLFLFLSFGNGGEKREKTRFFLSLFSGIFFLVLPLVLPLVPFAQGVLLPLSCGLLFLLPVCLPGDEDDPEGKGEERKSSAFFRLRFFALCAGFCLGGVLSVFPSRTVPSAGLKEPICTTRVPSSA